MLKDLKSHCNIGLHVYFRYVSYAMQSKIYRVPPEKPGSKCMKKFGAFGKSMKVKLAEVFAKDQFMEVDEAIAQATFVYKWVEFVNLFLRFSDDFSFSCGQIFVV